MLEVEDRREDLCKPCGEDEREVGTFAALGCSDAAGSDVLPLAGVDARELAPLNGSDLARMRLRERLLLGGLSAFSDPSGFGGSKLCCREGGAKSMLISGGDIWSDRP